MAKVDPKGSPLKGSAAGGMTMTQAVFGLLKAAIGAGAVLLPAGIARVGWLPGTAGILIAFATTTITLHFLARVAAHTECTSYFAIGRMAYGAAGEVSAMASLCLFIVGALIYYLVLASKTLVEVFFELSAADLESRTKWTIPLIAALVYPLALLRDMRMLGKTGIFGMMCMFFLLSLVLVRFAMVGVVSDTQMLREMSPEVIIAFASNLLFAFVSHFTMVASVPVLESPTSKRRMRLTAMASLGTVSFYLAIGLASYLSTGLGGLIVGGKNVTVIDLKAPYGLQTLFTIAKVAFSAMLVLSFPLQCDPVRACVENVVFSKSATKSAAVGYMSVRNMSVTGAIVALPAVVAMWNADAALSILQLFTAMAGSLLVFIFPSLYFLRLSTAARYRVSPTERVLAYVSIVLGVLLMIFGTFYGAKSVFKF